MHRPRTTLLGLLVVVLASGGLAFGGCGSSDSESSFDGDAGGTGDTGEPEVIPGLRELIVSPATVELVAGDTNQSQAFTAQGRFVDGSTRDVTALVNWSASPSSILANNGPTAVPVGARGGSAKLSARAGSISGSAVVTVKWTRTVLAPGAPPGSAGRFVGATEDPTLASTLAYPITGSLVPPNIPAAEIQWRPAATTDLFDVAVAGPTLDVHIVTPCTPIGATGGCGLVPDGATWTAITSTLAGEDPASITVRSAAATPGKIGTSASATIQMTSDPIKGGLYYFNTRVVNPGDKPGIFRYDFDTAKVGPFFTQGQCAGCHALSNDGTKMLAPICTDERGCGRPMQLAIVDVATKAVVTPPMPVGDSDTQTWSPDNKFYLTTPQCATISPTAPGACATPGTGLMTLISATTNTVVNTAPTDGAMYPSFSNDGKRVIYAKAGTRRGPLSIQKSSIFTMPFDGAATPPTWGTEMPLVTAGATDFENNFHPSFSPDDQWVVFTRSQCLAGDDPAAGDINANVCDSYNDTTARTWIVNAAGGTPIELATANGAGRNIVSWPKWAPFRGTYKGGQVLWVTVASARDYGLRALHTRDAQDNPAGVTQLWLVGIDVTKAAAGKDPSFAPVWLPFQDVQSSNHIGQWTTKIVGQVN